MPAPRGKKRKSEQSTASMDDHILPAETASRKVATKTGDDTEGSPRKKRRVDITLAQKQALIDNLQLEITERARKLRAHYNIHAQSLRTRIEIRVNRIPLALRKLKMGELLAKHSTDQQQQSTVPTASVFRPPPVPEKGPLVGRPVLQRGQAGNATFASPMRTAKRPSDVLSGGDKENEVTHIENPKKKARAGPAARPPPNPSQVLSPTSSNSRILPQPRERAAVVASPGRSLIARPVSPTKPATVNSGMFSNMVEKARSTRAAATARKTTMSSTASSSNGTTSAAAATRTRRGAATAAAPAPPRAGATSRTTRRVSAISESSDGSTGTVVRKRTTTVTTASAAPPPAKAAKRTVMGTIRKGVTGTATKKAPAAKAAPAAAASTGRVLRKRN